MPLTMRPSGLGSGIDKDRPDYTVFNGEWRSAASTRPVAVPTICAGSGRVPDDKIERSDDLGDANFRRVGMPGRHGRIGAARRLGDTDNS